MNIYMGMLAAIVLLALVFNGTLKKNKLYIITAALILFSFCALRGVRVGSDLGRYETHYRICYQLSFPGVLGFYQLKNIGFYMLMKSHSAIFGYNYHSFLFLLAVFEGIVFARVVYKHSVNPYLSYLLYIALGYYVFIYSGLKQALATAFIFLAFDSILEHRKIGFAICMLFAISVHKPSIIFAPAYIISHRRLDKKMLALYCFAALGVLVFRDQILSRMTDIYDSVVSSTQLGGVGGKVVMMLLFIISGYLLRTPDGENEAYCATSHYMIIAAMIQLFAVYGNVFERLADYYFIFSIFYLPFVFEKQNRREGSVYGSFYCGSSIVLVANVVILLFSIVYFYFNVTATYGLLPYRFN